MKSILIILSSLLLMNCQQWKTVRKLEYTASAFNFHGVDNKILKSELDSIVIAEEGVYLSDYKSNNSIERRAINSIREAIENQGLTTNDFVVKKENVHKNNYKWIFSDGYFDIQDSIYIFELKHIDGYVYSYNLEKLNAESMKHPSPNGAHIQISIAGNLSGYDGLCVYSRNTNKLRIFKHQ